MGDNFCHNCGKPLSKEVNFCPNCGAKKIVTEEYEKNTDSEPQKWRCPKCKSINSINSNICTECGTEVYLHEEILDEKELNGYHKQCSNCGMDLRSSTKKCPNCGSEKIIIVDRYGKRKKASLWPIVLLWCLYLWWSIWAHGLEYGIPLKTALMSNRSINVFLCIFTSLFFFDYLNNNSRPLFTYLLTITLFLLGIYLRLGFVFIIILTIIGIINFLKQFFQAIFQKNR